MYEKSWSYNVCFLRYRVQQTWFFCHFGPFFALLSHYWHWKFKTGYYPFTHSYHKWRSYDLWFLRCEAQQSFLLFWTIFCPFTLLTTQKIKILKKWKITPSDIIILHLVHHKWQLHDIWFLRYGAQQSFSSFWTIFCPFTPPP